jgi:polyribonucleotide nucleotidyltransferase
MFDLRSWRRKRLHSKTGPTVVLLDEREREFAEAVLAGQIDAAGTEDEVDEAPARTPGAFPLMELGRNYDGTVSRVTEDGAIVELLNGVEGFLDADELDPLGGVSEDWPGIRVPVAVSNIDARSGRIELRLALEPEAHVQRQTG